LNSRKKVFIYPIKHKLVWSQQAESTSFLHRVQGADPGIELLSRQLAFKAIKTLFPE
jgi:hypothetical protein